MTVPWEPAVSDSPLDAAGRAAVRRLAADVEAEDAAPPLSDQAVSRLGATGGTDLTARDGETVAGYARLEQDGPNTTAELVARPDTVAPLLDAVIARAPGERLLVWSHGAHSRVAPALAAAGFERVRELHQLRLPLEHAELPADPPLPGGVTVRAFRPGTDDAAWLALNAAAFASHPEQGRWTQRDLDARVAEPWFDPADFLVADRDGELVGFHWTKIHPDGSGEVYVLGVAPGAQGTGLGRALLVRGLRHLARKGCPVVLLYVDGDNTGAIRLYERAGFSRFDLDVQWAKTIRTADNETAS